MDRLKRYLPLAVLGAVVITFLVSGAGRYLSLDTLRTHDDALRGFVSDHIAVSLVLYVLAYTFVAAASVPGALALTLAGGFLFGVWMGGAATVVGATIGAILLYQVVHTSLGVALRNRAEASGGRLKAVMDGIKAGAFGYILTLRLIPIAPFWLVNVAAALAGAPLKAYALATFLGIMPATFIYSGIGAGIGEVLQQGGDPKLDIIFKPVVLGPLVALGLLTLGTTLYQRRRAAKSPGEETSA